MPRFRLEQLNKMIEEYLKPPREQGRPAILERLMERRRKERKERLELPKADEWI